MQTPNQTHGVHILDSIFAVAFEALAPDYLDRYQPADVRPIPENDGDWSILQGQEVQS